MDASVLTEPRAWRITKVNRLGANGLCHITLAQDHFDQHKDFVEIDEHGNVIGMWANYYDSSVTPIDPVPEHSGVHAEITYAGKTSDIKIGGSSKAFTIHFYDGEQETEVQPGVWSFEIDGEDVSGMLIQTIDGATNKIKFIGDESYIGDVLEIKYTTSDNIEAALQVQLIAL